MARSAPVAAKSSNTQSVTSMIWSAMNLRSFARRDFRVLQAALPFIDRPAGEIISRELREDRLEIDLPVAERAVAAGALEPSLVAAVDALLGGRIELGVLDVKHLDAFVIDVDEAEIVHALFDEVAGVVVDVAALVAADRLQEHVERVAVENVLGGMNLEAEIDAVFVENVENRLPPARLFGETFLDQAGGPLRIGIEIGPGERAGEGHVLGQPEPARRLARPCAPDQPPNGGASRDRRADARDIAHRTWRHRLDGPTPSDPGNGSRVR